MNLIRDTGNIYIRKNDLQSAYAQHILQNLHEYGSITDTMSLLKFTG